MSGSASAIFVEARDSGAVARLDPRIRLVAALLFVAALVPLRSPAALAAAVAVGIAAALAAQLPLRTTLHRMAAIEGFLALLLISLPFTVPGTEMFSLLGYPASWDGLGRALTIIARVNAAVLVIAALLSTMGTVRLAGAMTGLGIPTRLAYLFQLTVRYIAVCHDEYARLRRAMRARAFRAGSNRHSWRTLGNLLGMLLVRSTERAERVAWAMKCRGFSGRPPDFEQGRISFAGAAFSAAWIAMVMALLMLEYGT
jgi:cobalt/nickel transport system permease protein